MIFVQFYGKFKFQVPFYNNYSEKNALTDERVKFNPLQEPSTLREDIVGDYKDYFRFEFVDVTIKRIVKDNNVFDKEIHLEDNNDELLNSKVLFQGFLADISPHLNYGRLYPIVDDEGKIDYQSFGIKDKNNFTIFSSIPSCINNAVEWAALQSDLHGNLRSPLLHNTNDVRFRMSGNFTTTLTNIKFPREGSIKSPSLSKLSEAKNLSLFFQLSKFDFGSTIGEIIGYIGMNPNNNPLDNKMRSINRRIVLTPNINSEEYAIIRKDFFPDVDKKPNVNPDYGDVDARYDILEKERILVIRYLDFVSLVSYNNELAVYEPPLGYKYQFFIKTNTSRIPLGKQFELNGTVILESGGIIVLKIPDDANIQDSFKLELDITKNESSANFMIEPEFDIDMVNDVNRGIVMYSGDEKTLVALVYQNNYPKPHQKVYLSGDENNKDSPIVAKFNESLTYSSDNGIITVKVIATDIENLSQSLKNPVDDKTYGTNENNKSLPWDQYYGNYLYIKFKNESEESIRIINIPVRVIHKVPFDPSTISLSTINYKEHIHPLFVYYIRYYPWLHVKYNSDFEEFERQFDLNVELKVKNKINAVIERLSMDVTSEKKMPRSRDFPKGGIELIKRWKDSLL